MMGQKSEEKRQFILKQAREVFAKKGYRAVTMKDIVDACGISRGGLYLYFKSTKEICLALLKQEEEKAQNRFAEAVRDRTSSAEILVWYLSQQVEALFSWEDGLAAAGYEYAFSGGDVSDQTARLDASIRSLEYLLKVGSRRGELVCTDPHDEARAICLAVEGMRILSHTGGIRREDAENDLTYLLQRLQISQGTAFDRKP